MSVPRSLVSAARRCVARPPSTAPSSLYHGHRVVQASRRIHQNAPRKAQSAQPQAAPAENSSYDSTNPALSFPCLDAVESRSASLSRRSLSGPEPSYTSGAHQDYYSREPLLLDWGGILPEFNIGYETWGTLNKDKSNAIILYTGLSASSHAHSTEANPKPGWWEKFIGPGKALDTDKYFVICTNAIGGCYGSTGPSSIDPANGQQYATRFPILTMDDMVRASFRLVDALGIEKLYASVGSSMGGMQSLASGVLFSERIGRLVLMMDPNWARGFYYDSVPPHSGMKLAREIATVTYRSGPEWEQRFGRQRADPSRPPALCPDFLIETYLDHAGEKFCLEYDPNSLLYVSKAMDLFDLGQEHRNRINKVRQDNSGKLQAFLEGKRIVGNATNDLCNLTLPDQPYEEKAQPAEDVAPIEDNNEAPADLVAGMRPLANTPTLVLGVVSDILFPAWQQREIANTLKRTGNKNVTHIELGEEKSLFGHDTFLLDVENIGGAVKSFLG